MLFSLRKIPFKTGAVLGGVTRTLGSAEKPKVVPEVVLKKNSPVNRASN